MQQAAKLETKSIKRNEEIGRTLPTTLIEDLWPPLKIIMILQFRQNIQARIREKWSWDDEKIRHLGGDVVYCLRNDSCAATCSDLLASLKFFTTLRVMFFFAETHAVASTGWWRYATRWCLTYCNMQRSGK